MVKSTPTILLLIAARSCILTHAFIAHFGRNLSSNSNFAACTTETASPFVSLSTRGNDPLKYMSVSFSGNQSARKAHDSVEATSTIDKIETQQISSKPTISTITSGQEFLDFLEEDDRLCVIKFHANWCQICRNINRKYAKFALNLGDRAIIDPASSPGARVPGQVRFADVEWSANVELCKALKVKKFPFIMIYERSEKIGAFSTGPAHNFRPMVGDTIKEKLGMNDSEKEEFRAKFATNIAAGMADLEIIRSLDENNVVGNVELTP